MRHPKRQRLKWYHRSMLSHLPIIFVMITVISSISFLVVNEISSRQAYHANHVFTSYINDTLEFKLRETEYHIANDIVANPVIQGFFDSPGDGDAAAPDEYSVSQEIRLLTERYPLVKSVDLQRFRDGIVLTASDRGPLDSYADRDYVAGRVGQPSSVNWSPPRRMTDPVTGTEYWVISMTKQAPLPFGNEGLIVININLGSLMNTIDPFRNDTTFVQVWSGEERLYPFSQASAGEPEDRDEMKAITSITSDYTGLTIRSGLNHAVLFSWVSILTYVWIGAGVVVILLGIVLLIYISRRNYRPIEQIMTQIEKVQNRAPLEQNKNELSFIQGAVEHLIRQTQVYEQELKEDLPIRRNQFFRKLLESEPRVTPREWESETKRFDLRCRFAQMTFVLVELDGYREFCAKYSERDQGLLKFAMTNAMVEIASHVHCELWGEWISGQGFAVLIYDEKDSLSAHRSMVQDICAKLGAWVRKNLHFTVSAGIGTTGDAIDRIPESYQESRFALRFRLTLGGNRLFDIASLKREEDVDAYKFLQTIRTIVEGFRLNAGWKEQLRQMFVTLRSHPLPEDEIKNLAGYLIYLFKRNAEELPGDLSDYWERQLLPDLQGALERAESLEQVEEALTDSLYRMYDAFQLHMSARSHHSLVKEIRKYIEDHYTDPNLSLKDISDRYQANGKYISQLFKEEFGEKFVDFLVSLRMEHAKRLLVGTERSVENIALAVGYTSPISFSRTFKKVVGVTPIDYRRNMPGA